jgi:hypothetical protein
VTFTDAILSCFGANELFVNLTTGEKFQAITETDLTSRLREKGWRIPATSFFLSEVERAGFKVTQAYQFKGGKVARVFGDGSRDRRLGQYNTLITL